MFDPAPEDYARAKSMEEYFAKAGDLPAVLGIVARTAPDQAAGDSSAQQQQQQQPAPPQGPGQAQPAQPAPMKNAGPNPSKDAAAPSIGGSPHPTPAASASMLRVRTASQANLDGAGDDADEYIDDDSDAPPAAGDAGKQGDDDLDVMTHTETVSFTDPFSQLPMSQPARGRNCKHLSCFDLATFFQITYSPTQGMCQCPICNQPVLFEEIAISEKLLYSIQNAPPGVTSAQTKRSGPYTYTSKRIKRGESDGGGHPGYAAEASPVTPPPAAPGPSGAAPLAPVDLSSVAAPAVSPPSALAQATTQIACPVPPPGAIPTVGARPDGPTAAAVSSGVQTATAAPAIPSAPSTGQRVADVIELD